jgi:hypothetical protein
MGTLIIEGLRRKLSHNDSQREIWLSTPEFINNKPGQRQNGGRK